ncbi:hypothetical protein [Naasia aerilata]|uniref:DUF2530 domain-containing protein n=1 Tax=Naasia aerilata TaxID=1162966 RepID=A0ABN6XKE2_9MICO|nr:hypothetical protein [Naasia aerilata]BDZ45409.1 hypothetical protein GCM10025866_13180 [Naasia aerilata]
MTDEQFETTGAGGQPAATEPLVADSPRREPSAAAPLRRPARIGTMVWGFLVTAFAVVVALASDLVDIEDPTAWLIGGLVVGGAALIAAGVAASLRRTG